MSSPGRMSLNIHSCPQTPLTISSSQAHSRNIHQTQATAPLLTLGMQKARVDDYKGSSICYSLTLNGILTSGH